MEAFFNMPLNDIYAWTDGSIVLSWLIGSPGRFKDFVGKWFSTVLDHMPPDQWGHVFSAQGPADCAPRGLFPSKLICHDLWWSGPIWLKFVPLGWPKQDRQDS